MPKKLTCRTCSHFRAEGITDTHGDVPYNQCRRNPPEAVLTVEHQRGGKSTELVPVSFYPPIDDPDTWECGEHSGLQGGKR